MDAGTVPKILGKCAESESGRAAFSRKNGRCATLGKFSLTAKLSRPYLGLSYAGVAQLVEHHLAKVDVESSSLFARSTFKNRWFPAVFLLSLGA
jgi:hypothetical protein